MDNFLYAHKKTFTHSSKQTLTIYLDVNLKKNILNNVRFSGPLVSIYTKNIDELQNVLLNKALIDIPQIALENSLPLSLFYAALDEYQGNTPVIKEINNFICLCFGLTKNDIDKKSDSLAGRACGSCLPYIKKINFKKIIGLYPGPLAVKLDELKSVWEKENEVAVTILALHNNRVEVTISPFSKEKLKSLSDYWFLKLENRFFLRARP